MQNRYLWAIGTYLHVKCTRTRRRLHDTLSSRANTYILAVPAGADAHIHTCICRQVIMEYSVDTKAISRYRSETTTTQRPLAELNNGGPYRLPVFLSSIAACTRCILGHRRLARISASSDAHRMDQTAIRIGSLTPKMIKNLY